MRSISGFLPANSSGTVPNFIRMRSAWLRRSISLMGSPRVSLSVRSMNRDGTASPRTIMRMCSYVAPVSLAMSRMDFPCSSIAATIRSEIMVGTLLLSAIAVSPFSRAMPLSSQIIRLRLLDVKPDSCRFDKQCDYPVYLATLGGVKQMRKAVIVLVLCTTALAYEAPKPDKCPVFIASYYDATNRYAPLRVTLINNASQEVRAIKFGVYRHFTTGDNQRTDEVFSDTFNLKPGK